MLPTLLRLAGALELLGAIILAVIAMPVTKSCDAYLSHAPSFNACEATASSGSWTRFLTIMAEGIVVALVLFAVAGIFEMVRENRNRMAAIEAEMKRAERPE
ncbi:hypothetical protein FBZ83_10118 [Azospirillum brasilense]|uniref:Uncharacterized protein n=1 Tax=Azospirillum brasilense TaxID=192 RepID=A0A560CQM6_AZOBR|nr:hypothetical protein [Azospirillum brasilense]TWA87156.1 hypothetical protein FBZ83_10118 [Azospirillum brasilense]